MFKRLHKAGFFAMSVITVWDQAVGHIGRANATRPREDGFGLRNLLEFVGCLSRPHIGAMSQMLCFILTIRGLRRSEV